MSEKTENSTSQTLNNINNHMKDLSKQDPKWMQSFGNFMNQSKRTEH